MTRSSYDPTEFRSIDHSLIVIFPRPRASFLSFTRTKHPRITFDLSNFISQTSFIHNPVTSKNNWDLEQCQPT